MPDIVVFESIRAREVISLIRPTTPELLWGDNTNVGWTNQANAIDLKFNNVYASFLMSTSNKDVNSIQDTIEAAMTFISHISCEVRFYASAVLVDDSFLLQVRDNVAYSTQETFNSGNQPPSVITTKAYDVTSLLNSIVNINGARVRFAQTVVGGADATLYIDEARLLVHKLFIEQAETIDIVESPTMDVLINVNVFDTVSIVEDITRDLHSYINVDDTITATDNVTPSVDPLFVNVSELDIGIFEVVGVLDYPLYVGICIDYISASEVVTAYLDVLYASAFDTVTIAEFVLAHPTILYVAIDDTVSIIEDESIVLPFLVPDVFDSIAIAEVASALPDVLNMSAGEDISVFDIGNTIPICDVGPVEEHVVIVEDVALLPDVLFMFAFDDVTITEQPTYIADPWMSTAFDTVMIIEVVTASPDPLQVSASDSIAVGEPTDLAPDPLILELVDTISIIENLQRQMTISVNVSDTVTIVEVFDTIGLSYISRFELTHVTESVNVMAFASFCVWEDISVSDSFIAVVIPLLFMSVYEYVQIFEEAENAPDEMFIDLLIDTISIAEVAFIQDAKPVVGPIVENVLLIDRVSSIYIDALFMQNIIEVISITEVLVITPDPLYISLVDSISIVEVLADQETIDVFFAEDITIIEDLVIENPLVYMAAEEIITVVEEVIRDLQSSFSRIDAISISEATSIAPDPLNILLVENIVIDENLVDQEVMELLIFDTISIVEDIGLPEMLIGINEFEDIQFDDVIVSGPLIETLSMLIDLTPVSRVRRVIDLIRNP